MEAKQEREKMNQRGLERKKDRESGVGTERERESERMSEKLTRMPSP